MNKNKIIGNTLIFIIIMIYLGIFRSVFGGANSLVGITVITAVLMLTQRDLTAEPIKNFLTLLLVNVMTGVFSYIAVNNLWIGIPLNLIALFVIAYTFSSNIKGLVVIPFGLQYLFMISEPVYGIDFEKRMIALVFGAFFVMAIQFVVNKKKLEKTFNPSIINIIDSLIETISLPEYLLEPSPYVMGRLIDTLRDDEDTGNVLFKNIDNLKKIIYDKRKKGFYLNRGTKEVVDIVWILERISLNLHKDCIYKNKEFNKYLKSYLSEIKFSIENKKYSINYKEFYGNLDEDMLEVKKTIDDLVININQLMKIENMKKHDFHIKAPKHFSKLEIAKKDFKIDSLRVSYALRLAILGAFTLFLTKFFNLTEGRWMVYTIFALIQPYKEVTIRKSKDRIQGTIIGVLLVIVVFMIFKNTQVRMLSILFMGYLNPYAQRYRNMVICITFSAVASLAITENITVILGGERLFFVAIGVIIALIGSKYIIPYNIENTNQYIIKNYNKLRFQLKKDINTSQVEDGIKLLYVLPAFFEEKLVSLNTGEKLKELKEFTKNQRLIINNLYEKYYNKIKTVG
ncbi:MAG: FUSC family protein [Sarcina ventriculi]|nr:FUSC family protein [Sarcina ventriculi]